MSIDLSLDRIRHLAAHLPPYSRPTCHIAGTNGKGSVCALLSSIFLSAGLSVGRFNSPHLVSVHDSIAVNNSPVEPDAFGKAQRAIKETAKAHDLSVSSFELLTLTALRIFQEANVDVVVLEVGLGGRLDATNVIPDNSVLISALTAVDLDHQAFLGPTVGDIAREKASIAREGKPFVLGCQQHDQVRIVAQDVLTNIGAELILTPEHVVSVEHPIASPFLLPPALRSVQINMPGFSQQLTTEFPLHGEHQLENLKLALTIVSALCRQPGFPEKLKPEAIIRGIQTVSWPGRLSFHERKTPNGRTLILTDGAHNPASATALANYIAELYATVDPSQEISLSYVLALSHSPPKTPLETLSPLLPPKIAAKVRVSIALLSFTPPAGMPWVKSVPPRDLQDVVRMLMPSADVWVGEALEDALNWAAERSGDNINGLVVVAGSLYLVADLYRLLYKGP